MKTFAFGLRSRRYHRRSKAATTATATSDAATTTVGADTSTTMVTAAEFDSASSARYSGSSNYGGDEDESSEGDHHRVLHTTKKTKKTKKLLTLAKKKNKKRHSNQRRRCSFSRYLNSFDDDDHDETDTDEYREDMVFHRDDPQDYYFNKYRVAELGTPKKRLLRNVETLQFKIHDFVNCAQQRGEFLLTPTVLQAHGCAWKVQVYPRGDHRSSNTDDYVSIYLHYIAPSPQDRHRNRNKKETGGPTAQVTYHVGTHKTQTQVCTFGGCVNAAPGNHQQRSTTTTTSSSWGLENFIKRRNIVHRPGHYLDQDGCLTITLDLRLAVERSDHIWYPPVMRNEPTLAQLYVSSPVTGDITFRVRQSTAATTTTKSARGRLDPSPHYTNYKAHKMILALRAKLLYALISEDDDEADAIIELPDCVESDIFEAMLEHMYTIQQPRLEDVATAQKFLVAADRFDMIALKLYVESVLVDKFLDVTTAAELVVVGDAYTCALLKEAAMAVVCNNYGDRSSTITTSAGWQLLEESTTLLAEVLQQYHTTTTHSTPTMTMTNFSQRSGKKNAITNIPDIDADAGNTTDSSAASNDDDDDSDLDRADIFALRERLTEIGLEVDGSRETLLRRLRQNVSNE